ncbi:hypothetical protein J2X77_000733 [Sphingobacterium sp. 2149]|nr:hypothetical protein [Sphingobacterium sp. 2149]
MAAIPHIVVVPLQLVADQLSKKLKALINN